MASKVFRFHLGLIAALLAIHLAAKLIYFGAGNANLFGFAPLFDLVSEQSVPNFFSAAALMGVAGAAGLIARTQALRGERLKGQWRFVTLVALFLAFDEGAAIHDRLTVPVQSLLNSHGLLFVGWVIPYSALVLVTAYLMWPLARSLPVPIRNQLIVAAGIYVASALGLEMVEAAQMDRATAGDSVTDVDGWAINHTPSMVALVTIEETGEMLGVALALRALLSYLTDNLGVRLFVAGALTVAHHPAASTKHADRRLNLTR
jgi:hypothetical protein